MSGLEVLGDLHVTIARDSGPPTWWLPRVIVRHVADRCWGVKFGWLRTAYTVLGEWAPNPERKSA